MSELAHAGTEARSTVPPFFIISRGSKGLDVVLRGLAVAGAVHIDHASDLIAVWKSVDGQRFKIIGLHLPFWPVTGSLVIGFRNCKPEKRGRLLPKCLEQMGKDREAESLVG